MDLYIFLKGLICVLGFVISLILSRNMPDIKSDEYLSKISVYFGGAILLIVGVIWIIKSFS